MISYADLVGDHLQKLNKFRAWMLKRGRTEGTADLYVKNVRYCLEDPDGLTNRLIAGDLAPNTSRSNLAALRAWALFNDDTKLTKELADIRLPPPRRVRTKIPLELSDLKKLIQHLRSCRMRNEGKRQTLLIMALRGLRCGDVLRVQRHDVIRALRTGRLIYEGKGRKLTEISAAPIRGPLEALSEIDGWETVSDLVSGSTKPESISRIIRKAAKSAGKAAGVADVYPHRLRRTFATQYLQQLKGDPNALVKLQKYMQWESLSTAAQYVDAVSHVELDDIGAALAGGLLEPVRSERPSRVGKTPSYRPRRRPDSAG